AVTCRMQSVTGRQSQTGPAHDVDLASVARLIGEPSRATMLLALLDGRALTAGELARCARLTPATTSAHLSKLLDADVVSMVAQGRHRYYRLAGPAMANALEALSQVSRTAVPTGLRTTSAARALRPARLCYDHVAGQLGVAIHDCLVDIDGIAATSEGLSLTRAGEHWFSRAGVTVSSATSSRRTPLRSCLDWTERRIHLAGALAASLATAMLEQQWLVRRAIGERGLDITGEGAIALTDLLGHPVASTRGDHALAGAAS
ncbi:MAG: winged helix-turn-helix transcriptional regulator, partial [Ilumatobacteraceae bacterium]|nr:winged helix-turn-helix transcriptional regulator [Ilumatobacteraceae bacterium]